LRAYDDIAYATFDAAAAISLDYLLRHRAFFSDMHADYAAYAASMPVSLSLLLPCRYAFSYAAAQLPSSPLMMPPPMRCRRLRRRHISLHWLSYVYFSRHLSTLRRHLFSFAAAIIFALISRHAALSMLMPPMDAAGCWRTCLRFDMLIRYDDTPPLISFHAITPLRHYADMPPLMLRF